jgi:hypothetical protein
VLDNPQVQGIDVAPLNVEVWGIEPQEQEGKAIYSFKLECHNSSYLCTNKLNMQRVVGFNLELKVKQHAKQFKGCFLWILMDLGSWIHLIFLSLNNGGILISNEFYTSVMQNIHRGIMSKY